MHWFGLTDGWCWWNVGSQQLFRYSQQFLDQLAKKYPDDHSEHPYNDYQIARSWEDLLVCLPDVLQPLPEDLIQHSVDAERWQSLQDRAWDWVTSENSDFAWGLFDVGFRWWWNQKWDAGYLRHPPKIRFWTQGVTFHIRWDNRDVIDDGMPVWDATYGEITMPVAEFAKEVESFNDRLILQMAERVKAVRAGALRPEIKVNSFYLAQDEFERPLKLNEAFSRSQEQEDWNKVREALATLERICYNNGVEGP